MHGVPRRVMFKKRTRLCAVYSDVLSHTMSEIRSAAASSIHAARRSHSARQRYQTPRRRHGNRPTSANQNPSPPISPGNCRSAGASRERARHPILHRAMCFHFYRQLLAT